MRCSARAHLGSRRYWRCRSARNLSNLRAAARTSLFTSGSDRLWRGLRNSSCLLGLLHRRPSSSVFRTGRRLRPTRDRLPDLRRSTEFRGPCSDYLLGILAISLPSQGAGDTNANRDQETNERSQDRCLKGSSNSGARIGLSLTLYLTMLHLAF
jgi:hypothetical protein